MPRIHRHQVLPEEQLEPTWSPPGLDRRGQTKSMTELRRRTNEIAGAYQARDDLLLALATSNSLSRRDMARATGLNKSRVDQLIREMADEQRQRWAGAGAERVARHMPPSGAVMVRR